MIHRHRELIWATASVPVAMIVGVGVGAAFARGIPALAIVGLLAIGVLSWRGQEATVYLWGALGAPQEPQVSPWELRRHTDRLSDLSHALRASHSRGAAELTAIARDALNMERASRGLPPMSPYRGQDDVSRPEFHSDFVSVSGTDPETAIYLFRETSSRTTIYPWDGYYVDTGTGDLHRVP